MLHKILLLVNELLLLQAAGFNVYAVTGSAWYLSAMFIAIAVIYPILIRCKDLFLDLLAPIIAVIILGALSAAYGNTTNPGYMIQGFLFLGLLKAIAEISLGCFLYKMVILLNSTLITSCQKILLTVLKYASLIFVVYFASIADINSVLLPSCVPCLFLGLLLTFSNQCYRLSETVAKISSYLGDLSIAIYLNNFYVALIVAKVCTTKTNSQKLTIYLIAVFVIANIVLLLAKRIRRIDA